MWFAIPRIRPAIDIALEEISKHHQLINGTQLGVKYADSKCHISEAINQAFTFYMQKEVNVFFGPCCDYAAAPIARQIRYWNLPMVTAGAMAGDFGLLKLSTYPLLTRVGPDFNSLARFVFSVMDYYEWHKVKLVYQPFGQEAVIEKFCHLAADGIHRAILEKQILGYPIEQDYFKFMKAADFSEKMPSELGNEFSSK